ALALALSQTFMPCADRFVLRPALCAGDAVVLPGNCRQSPGPQEQFDAVRADRGPRADRPVRRPPAIPPRLCTVAYDQPHRRRARAASVPPSIAPAARVFRDPTGRADGGARPRAREYPAIPDRAGPVLGSRLVLRVRTHRC